MKLAAPRSLFMEALIHPLNIAVAGAGLFAGLATGSAFLFVATAGIEALWLLFAPDSRPFKAWVAKEARSLEDKARLDRINQLGYTDRAGRKLQARAMDLYRLRQEVGTQMESIADVPILEHQRFTALLDAYLDHAEAAQRLDAYRPDLDSMETRLRELRIGADRAAASSAKALLERSAGLIEQRIRILRGLTGRQDQIHGQMEVIDSTFHLMVDQWTLHRSTAGVEAQIEDVMREVAALQTVLESEGGEGFGSQQVDARVEGVVEAEPIEESNVRPIHGRNRTRGGE